MCVSDVFFFFKQKTAYEMRISDWSSDVCSSDLVGEALRPFRASSDLWLCFAPIRQGRIEMIVEKATELGAGRLQPVLTRRSQVTRVNAERLAAHAREAAEQCARLDLPALEIGRAAGRERGCPYV